MRFPFSKPRIEELDRYLARKEYDKALQAVTNELKRNPAQFNLLLRQAEILGLAGDRDRAITLYRELAERYTKEGFYAKSIALYKKILRLEPSAEDVHEELARLIEEDTRTRLPLEQRLAAMATAERRSKAHATDPEQDQHLKELQASALFAAFEKEALQELLTSTTLRSYREGEVIVTEGEPGSSLFLMVSGTVQVFTRDEGTGEPVHLAQLGPGDFFGEVSLLTGKPRTATITADSQVMAIELARESVDRIAARHPEVRRILEEFCNRRAEEAVEAIIRRRRSG